jgi:hypothetical protein
LNAAPVRNPALFVRIQTRRDEHPDLVHDDRRGQHHSGDERDRDVEVEGFARLRVDERRTRRQRGPRRRHQKIEDLVDEEETDEHANGDGDARPYDATPKLIEMLQERHLSAG